MANGLRNFLTVLWIGAMWTVGVLVAPVLFSHVDHATAGRLAGILFRAVAWIGMAAGIYLLGYTLWQEGLKAFQTSPLWLLLLMLVLTLVNHFAIFPLLDEVKPQMHAAAEGLFGGGFQNWHTISSLIYLVQSLCGVVYVVRSGGNG